MINLIKYGIENINKEKVVDYGIRYLDTDGVEILYFQGLYFMVYYMGHLVKNKYVLKIDNETYSLDSLDSLLETLGRL